jgi:predicted AAA+ superfamily ATPase
MVERQFWLSLIEQAWQRRNVLWLAGVRRVGKTVLSQCIPDVEYFDCELPRVRTSMVDPQGFLAGLKGRRIVLDEIHRLSNPSELLKIASDYHPQTKIIATGSSSLGASAKFKDTLAGRKTELWLTPLMSHDLRDFKRQDLMHRFLHGGLPPFFLAPEFPERDIQEWMDAYWSKDIQELFRLERRHSFQKFVELLMAQSGGIFEATKFARPCEVNRMTISNYLKVLEVTFVAIVVRPFSSRRSTEIIAAPKVYGFDTGFVCYFRGWHELRRQDIGPLWEHYVLNELHAQLQTRQIQYWRDKRGHEIDFVLAQRAKPPIAIECKWSAEDFDSTSALAFSRQYPKAAIYVVAQDVDRPFSRMVDDTTLEFTNLASLTDALKEKMK